MISILRLVHRGKDIAGHAVVAIIGVGTVPRRPRVTKITLPFAIAWGVAMPTVYEGQGMQVVYWVIMILTII